MMCRCRHNRRSVLAMMAAVPVLVACKPQTEGPEQIRWGRETCEICGMIISDARYGAEVRGGADRRLRKFDDIGDAIHWLELQSWRNSPDVEIWVMDSNNATDWLDARQVFYHPETISPMDYGYAAVPTPEPGTVSFAEMKEGVMLKGLSSRCLPFEEIEIE